MVDKPKEKDDTEVKKLEDPPKPPEPAPLNTQIYNDVRAFLDAFDKDLKQKEQSTKDKLTDLKLDSGKPGSENKDADKSGGTTGDDKTGGKKPSRPGEPAGNGEDTLKPGDLKDFDQRLAENLKILAPKLASPESLRQLHDRIGKVITDWDQPGQFIRQAKESWPQVDDARRAYEKEVLAHFDRFAENASKLLGEEKRFLSPSVRSEVLARMIQEELERARKNPDPDSPTHPLAVKYQAWQDAMKGFAGKALGQDPLPADKQAPDKRDGGEPVEKVKPVDKVEEARLQKRELDVATAHGHLLNNSADVLLGLTESYAGLVSRDHRLKPGEKPTLTPFDEAWEKNVRAFPDRLKELLKDKKDAAGKPLLDDAKMEKIKETGLIPPEVLFAVVQGLKEEQQKGEIGPFSREMWRQTGAYLDYRVPERAAGLANAGKPPEAGLPVPVDPTTGLPVGSELFRTMVQQGKYEPKTDFRIPDKGEIGSEEFRKLDQWAGWYTKASNTLVEAAENFENKDNDRKVGRYRLPADYSSDAQRRMGIDSDEGRVAFRTVDDLRQQLYETVQIAYALNKSDPSFKLQLPPGFELNTKDGRIVPVEGTGDIFKKSNWPKDLRLDHPENQDAMDSIRDYLKSYGSKVETTWKEVSSRMGPHQLIAYGEMPTADNEFKKIIPWDGNGQPPEGAVVMKAKDVHIPWDGKSEVPKGLTTIEKDGKQFIVKPGQKFLLVDDDKKNPDQQNHYNMVDYNYKVEKLPNGNIQVTPRVQFWNIPQWDYQNIRAFGTMRQEMELQPREYKPDELVAVKGGNGFKLVQAKELDGNIFSGTYGGEALRDYWLMEKGTMVAFDALTLASAGSAAWRVGAAGLRKATISAGLKAATKEAAAQGAKMTEKQYLATRIGTREAAHVAVEKVLPKTVGAQLTEQGEKQLVKDLTKRGLSKELAEQTVGEFSKKSMGLAERALLKEKVAAHLTDLAVDQAKKTGFRALAGETWTATKMTLLGLGGVTSSAGWMDAEKQPGNSWMKAAREQRHLYFLVDPLRSGIAQDGKMFHAGRWTRTATEEAQSVGNFLKVQGHWLDNVQPLVHAGFKGAEWTLLAGMVKQMFEHGRKAPATDKQPTDFKRQETARERFDLERGMLDGYKKGINDGIPLPKGKERDAIVAKVDEILDATKKAREPGTTDEQKEAARKKLLAHLTPPADWPPQDVVDKLKRDGTYEKEAESGFLHSYLQSEQFKSSPHKDVFLAAATGLSYLGLDKQGDVLASGEIDRQGKKQQIQLSRDDVADVLKSIYRTDEGNDVRRLVTGDVAYRLGVEVGDGSPKSPLYADFIDNVMHKQGESKEKDYAQRLRALGNLAELGKPGELTPFDITKPDVLKQAQTELDVYAERFSRNQDASTKDSIKKIMDEAKLLLAEMNEKKGDQKELAEKVERFKKQLLSNYFEDPNVSIKRSTEFAHLERDMQAATGERHKQLGEQIEGLRRKFDEEFRAKNNKSTQAAAAAAIFYLSRDAHGVAPNVLAQRDVPVAKYDYTTTRTVSNAKTGESRVETDHHSVPAHNVTQTLTLSDLNKILHKDEVYSKAPEDAARRMAIGDLRVTAGAYNRQDFSQTGRQYAGILQDILRDPKVSSADKLKALIDADMKGPKLADIVEALRVQEAIDRDTLTAAKQLETAGKHAGISSPALLKTLEEVAANNKGTELGAVAAEIQYALSLQDKVECRKRLDDIAARAKDLIKYDNKGEIVEPAVGQKGFQQSFVDNMRKEINHKDVGSDFDQRLRAFQAAEVLGVYSGPGQAELKKEVAGAFAALTDPSSFKKERDDALIAYQKFIDGGGKPDKAPPDLLERLSFAQNDYLKARAMSKLALETLTIEGRLKDLSPEQVKAVTSNFLKELRSPKDFQRGQERNELAMQQSLLSLVKPMLDNAVFSSDARENETLKAQFKQDAVKHLQGLINRGNSDTYAAGYTSLKSAAIRALAEIGSQESIPLIKRAFDEVSPPAQTPVSAVDKTTQSAVKTNAEPAEVQLAALEALTTLDARGMKRTLLDLAGRSTDQAVSSRVSELLMPQERPDPTSEKYRAEYNIASRNLTRSFGGLLQGAKDYLSDPKFNLLNGDKLTNEMMVQGIKATGLGDGFWKNQGWGVEVLTDGFTSGISKLSFGLIPHTDFGKDQTDAAVKKIQQVYQQSINQFGQLKMEALNSEKARNALAHIVLSNGEPFRNEDRARAVKEAAEALKQACQMNPPERSKDFGPVMELLAMHQPNMGPEARLSILRGLEALKPGEIPGGISKDDAALAAAAALQTEMARVRQMEGGALGTSKDVQLKALDIMEQCQSKKTIAVLEAIVSQTDYPVAEVRDRAAQLLAKHRDHTATIMDEAQKEVNNRAGLTVAELTKNLKDTVLSKDADSNAVSKAIFMAALAGPIKEPNDERRELLRQLVDNNNVNEKIKLAASKVLMTSELREDRELASKTLATISSFGSREGYRQDASETLMRGLNIGSGYRYVTSEKDPMRLRALELLKPENAGKLDDSVRLQVANILAISQLPQDKKMAADVVMQVINKHYDALTKGNGGSAERRTIEQALGSLVRTGYADPIKDKSDPRREMLLKLIGDGDGGKLGDPLKVAAAGALSQSQVPEDQVQARKVCTDILERNWKTGSVQLVRDAIQIASQGTHLLQANDLKERQLKLYRDILKAENRPDLRDSVRGAIASALVGSSTSAEDRKLANANFVYGEYHVPRWNVVSTVQPWQGMQWSADKTKYPDAPVINLYHQNDEALITAALASVARPPEAASPGRKPVTFDDLDHKVAYETAKSRITSQFEGQMRKFEGSWFRNQKDRYDLLDGTRYSQEVWGAAGAELDLRKGGHLGAALDGVKLRRDKQFQSLVDTARSNDPQTAAEARMALAYIALSGGMPFRPGERQEFSKKAADAILNITKDGSTARGEFIKLMKLCLVDQPELSRESRSQMFEAFKNMVTRSGLKDTTGGGVSQDEAAVVVAAALDTEMKTMPPKGHPDFAASEKLQLAMLKELEGYGYRKITPVLEAIADKHSSDAVKQKANELLLKFADRLSPVRDRSQALLDEAGKPASPRQKADEIRSALRAGDPDEIIESIFAATHRDPQSKRLDDPIRAHDDPRLAPLREALQHKNQLVRTAAAWALAESEVQGAAGNADRKSAIGILANLETNGTKSWYRSEAKEILDQLKKNENLAPVIDAVRRASAEMKTLDTTQETTLVDRLRTQEESFARGQQNQQQLIDASKEYANFLRRRNGPGDEEKARACEQRAAEVLGKWWESTVNQIRMTKGEGSQEHIKAVCDYSQMLKSRDFIGDKTKANQLDNHAWNLSNQAWYKWSYDIQLSAGTPNGKSQWDVAAAKEDHSQWLRGMIKQRNWDNPQQKQYAEQEANRLHLESLQVKDAAWQSLISTLESKPADGKNAEALSLALSGRANLLEERNQGNDKEEAQRLRQRSLEVTSQSWQKYAQDIKREKGENDPAYAFALGNYAVWLRNVKGDEAKAKEVDKEFWKLGDSAFDKWLEQSKKSQGENSVEHASALLYYAKMLGERKAPGDEAKGKEVAARLEALNSSTVATARRQVEATGKLGDQKLAPNNLFDQARSFDLESKRLASSNNLEQSGQASGFANNSSNLTEQAWAKLATELKGLGISDDKGLKTYCDALAARSSFLRHRNWQGDQQKADSADKEMWQKREEAITSRIEGLQEKVDESNDSKSLLELAKARADYADLLRRRDWKDEQGMQEEYRKARTEVRLPNLGVYNKDLTESTKQEKLSEDLKEQAAKKKIEEATDTARLPQATSKDIFALTQAHTEYAHMLRARHQKENPPGAPPKTPAGRNYLAEAGEQDKLAAAQIRQAWPKQLSETEELVKSKPSDTSHINNLYGAKSFAQSLLASPNESDKTLGRDLLVRTFKLEDQYYQGQIKNASDKIESSQRKSTELAQQLVLTNNYAQVVQQRMYLQLPKEDKDAFTQKHRELVSETNKLYDKYYEQQLKEIESSPGFTSNKPEDQLRHAQTLHQYSNYLRQRNLTKRDNPDLAEDDLTRSNAFAKRAAEEALSIKSGDTNTINAASYLVRTHAQQMLYSPDAKVKAEGKELLTRSIATEDEYYKSKIKQGQDQVTAWDGSSQSLLPLASVTSQYAQALQQREYLQQLLQSTPAETQALRNRVKELNEEAGKLFDRYYTQQLKEITESPDFRAGKSSALWQHSNALSQYSNYLSGRNWNKADHKDLAQNDSEKVKDLQKQAVDQNTKANEARRLEVAKPPEKAADKAPDKPADAERKKKDKKDEKEEKDDQPVQAAASPLALMLLLDKLLTRREKDEQASKWIDECKDLSDPLKAEYKRKLAQKELTAEEVAKLFDPTMTQARRDIFDTLLDPKKPAYKAGKEAFSELLKMPVSSLEQLSELPHTDFQTYLKALDHSIGENKRLIDNKSLEQIVSMDPQERSIWKAELDKVTKGQPTVMSPVNLSKILALQTADARALFAPGNQFYDALKPPTPRLDQAAISQILENVPEKSMAVYAKLDSATVEKMLLIPDEVRQPMERILATQGVTKETLNKVFDKNGNYEISVQVATVYADALDKGIITPAQLNRLQDQSQLVHDAYNKLLADQTALAKDHLTYQTMDKLLRGTPADVLDLYREALKEQAGKPPILTDNTLSKLVDAHPTSKEACHELIQKKLVDSQTLKGLLDAQAQPQTLKNYVTALNEGIITPEQLSKIVSMEAVQRTIFQENILPGELKTPRTLGDTNFKKLLESELTPESLRGIYKAASDGLKPETLHSLLSQTPECQKMAGEMLNRGEISASQLTRLLDEHKTLPPEVLSRYYDKVKEISAARGSATFANQLADEIIKFETEAGNKITAEKAFELATVLNLTEQHDVTAESLKFAKAKLEKIEEVRTELKGYAGNIQEPLDILRAREALGFQNLSDAQKFVAEAKDLLSHIFSESYLGPGRLAPSTALDLAILIKRDGFKFEQPADQTDKAELDAFRTNREWMQLYAEEAKQIDKIRRLNPDIGFEHAKQASSLHQSINDKELTDITREFIQSGVTDESKARKALHDYASAKATETQGTNEHEKWNKLKTALANNDPVATTLSRAVLADGADTKRLKSVVHNLTAREIAAIPKAQHREALIKALLAPPDSTSPAAAESLDSLRNKMTEGLTRRFVNTLIPPVVDREVANHLFGKLSDAERARALEYLKQRENFLSDAGLRGEFNKLAESLVSRGLTTTDPGAYGNNPVRKIYAYCTTSEGEALAYKFSKASGFAVEIVRPGETVPEKEKMVLFDAPGRTPAHEQTVKNLTESGRLHQFDFLNEFGTGLNVFDMAAGKVNPEAAAAKLRSAIKAEGDPATAQHRPLTDVELKQVRASCEGPVQERRKEAFDGIMDRLTAETSTGKRKLSPQRALYETYITQGTTRVVNSRDTMQLASDLHTKLFGGRTLPADSKLPSNVLFVAINRTPGKDSTVDSAHLAVQTYRQANGLTDPKYNDHFVTPEQLKARMEQAAQKGQKLEIYALNDNVSTGGEAHAILERLNAMKKETKCADAQVKYATFMGYERGMAKSLKDFGPDAIVTAEPPMTSFGSQIERRLGNIKEAQLSPEDQRRVRSRYQNPSSREAAFTTGVVMPDMYAHSLTRGQSDLLTAAGWGRWQSRVRVEPDTTTGETFGRYQLNITGVDRVGIVDDQLLRSARPKSEKSIIDAKEKGITVIVDLTTQGNKVDIEERDVKAWEDFLAANKDKLRPEECLIDRSLGRPRVSEAAACLKHGIEYWHPTWNKSGQLSDDGKGMTAKHATAGQVQDVLKRLEEYRGREEIVLLHCQAGKDRTGVVMASLKTSRGESLDSAKAEMAYYGITPGNEHLLGLIPPPPAGADPALKTIDQGDRPIGQRALTTDQQRRVDDIQRQLNEEYKPVTERERKVTELVMQSRAEQKLVVQQMRELKGQGKDAEASALAVESEKKVSQQQSEILVKEKELSDLRRQIEGSDKVKQLKLALVEARGEFPRGEYFLKANGQEIKLYVGQDANQQFAVRDGNLVRTNEVGASVPKEVVENVLKALERQNIHPTSLTIVNDRTNPSQGSTNIETFSIRINSGDVSGEHAYLTYLHEGHGHLFDFKGFFPNASDDLKRRVWDAYAKGASSDLLIETLGNEQGKNFYNPTVRDEMVRDLLDPKRAYITNFNGRVEEARYLASYGEVFAEMGKLSAMKHQLMDEMRNRGETVRTPTYDELLNRYTQNEVRREMLRPFAEMFDLVDREVFPASREILSGRANPAVKLNDLTKRIEAVPQPNELKKLEQIAKELRLTEWSSVKEAAQQMGGDYEQSLRKCAMEKAREIAADRQAKLERELHLTVMEEAKKAARELGLPPGIITENNVKIGTAADVAANKDPRVIIINPRAEDATSSLKAKVESMAKVVGRETIQAQPLVNKGEKTGTVEIPSERGVVKKEGMKLQDRQYRDGVGIAIPNDSVQLFRPRDVRIYTVDGQSNTLVRQSGTDWFEIRKPGLSPELGEGRGHLTITSPGAKAAIDRVMIPLLSDAINGRTHKPDGQETDAFRLGLIDKEGKSLITEAKLRDVLYREADHAKPEVDAHLKRESKTTSEPGPGPRGENAQDYALQARTPQDMEKAAKIIDAYLKEKGLSLDAGARTGNISDLIRLPGSNRICVDRREWPLTQGADDRWGASLEDELGRQIREKYGKNGRVTQADLDRISDQAGIARGQLTLDKDGKLMFRSADEARLPTDDIHDQYRGQKEFFDADKERLTPAGLDKVAEEIGLRKGSLTYTPEGELVLKGRTEIPFHVDIGKLGKDFRDHIIDEGGRLKLTPAGLDMLAEQHGLTKGDIVYNQEGKLVRRLGGDQPHFVDDKISVTGWNTMHTGPEKTGRAALNALYLHVSNVTKEGPDPPKKGDLQYRDAPADVSKVEPAVSDTTAKDTSKQTEKKQFNLADERKALEQRAESVYKGEPERLKMFKQLMKDFEQGFDRRQAERMSKMAPELAKELAAKLPGEKAATLHHIERLLASETGGQIPEIELRKHLAEGMLDTFRDPYKRNQGDNPTCAAESYGKRLADRSPALVADMVAQAVLDGKVNLQDGTVVDMRESKVPGAVRPDGEALEISKRRFDPAQPYDHLTSHRGRALPQQITEMVLLNADYQMRTRNGEHTFPTGTLRYAKSPELAAKDSPDPRQRTRTDRIIGPDGKPVADFNGVTDQTISQLHKRVTGEADSDFIIRKPKNMQEFSDTLRRLQREGKLPAHFGVDARNEPFSKKGAFAAATGSHGTDGAHAVTIVDARWNGDKLVQVTISNHWDSQNNVFDLPAHTALLATRGEGDIYLPEPEAFERDTKTIKDLLKIGKEIKPEQVRQLNESVDRLIESLGHNHERLAQLGAFKNINWMQEIEIKERQDQTRESLKILKQHADNLDRLAESGKLSDEQTEQRKQIREIIKTEIDSSLKLAKQKGADYAVDERVSSLAKQIESSWMMDSLRNRPVPTNVKIEPIAKDSPFHKLGADAMVVDKATGNFVLINLTGGERADRLKAFQGFDLMEGLPKPAVGDLRTTSDQAGKRLAENAARLQNGEFHLNLLDVSTIAMMRKERPGMEGKAVEGFKQQIETQARERNSTTLRDMAASPELTKQQPAAAVKPQEVEPLNKQHKDSADHTVSTVKAKPDDRSHVKQPQDVRIEGKEMIRIELQQKQTIRTPDGNKTVVAVVISKTDPKDIAYQIEGQTQLDRGLAKQHFEAIEQSLQSARKENPTGAYEKRQQAQLQALESRLDANAVKENPGQFREALRQRAEMLASFSVNLAKVSPAAPGSQPAGPVVAKPGGPDTVERQPLVPEPKKVLRTTGGGEVREEARVESVLATSIVDARKANFTKDQLLQILKAGSEGLPVNEEHERFKKEALEGLNSKDPAVVERTVSQVNERLRAHGLEPHLEGGKLVGIARNGKEVARFEPHTPGAKPQGGGVKRQLTGATGLAVAGLMFYLMFRPEGQSPLQVIWE